MNIVRLKLITCLIGLLLVPVSSFSATLEAQLRQTALDRLGVIEREIEKYEGLEILYAKAPLNPSVATRFGHISLRLRGPNSETDPVFSWTGFSENKVPDQLIPQIIDGVKSSVGVYPNLVDISILKDVFKKYVIWEERNIYSIFIPSTLESRKRLLQIVRKLLEHPELQGRYYAYGNNCTSVVTSILYQAGISFFKLKANFPENVSEVVSFTLASPFPERMVISPDVILEGRKQGLSSFESMLDNPVADENQIFENGIQNPLSFVTSAFVGLSQKDRAAHCKGLARRMKFFKRVVALPDVAAAKVDASRPPSDFVATARIHLEVLNTICPLADQ